MSLLPSLSYATPPWEHCLHHYAHQLALPPQILQAIVDVESNGRPYAFSWRDPDDQLLRTFIAPDWPSAVIFLQRLNQANLRFDMGLGQVNSRNLKRYETQFGIRMVEALNPCTNLRLATEVLKENIQTHGRTWKAIAAYNGSPSYIQKVWKAWCKRMGPEYCRRPEQPSLNNPAALFAQR